LGEERTNRAMNLFNLKYNIDKSEKLADARLIKFSENLLTGHIGTASAKILISSVVKEEKITLPEVLKYLKNQKRILLLIKNLQKHQPSLKKFRQNYSKPTSLW
jgi:pantothenate kinase type III